MEQKDIPCNPVVFEYRGFSVKRSNPVKLNLDEREYKRLIDAYHDADGALSFSKIIALQGRPCQQCGCDNALIPVKKGLLSIVKQSSGVHPKQFPND